MTIELEPGCLNVDGTRYPVPIPIERLLMPLVQYWPHIAPYSTFPGTRPSLKVKVVKLRRFMKAHSIPLNVDCFSGEGYRLRRAA